MAAFHEPFHKAIHHQAGMALVVALIVLIAMSLAGTAIMRSVDTSFLIAGNLAFRRGATTSGDAGVEAARTWLMANSGVLESDQTAQGYYATSQDALDLTGNATKANTSDDVSWTGGGVSQPKCLATDAAGNTVCYIIHRLCNSAGPLDAGTCSTQQTTKGGNTETATRPEEGYNEGTWDEVATMGFYRVTVRVAAPRQNISFVQAFILI